ncbi:mannose-ethanolamine phosphotransferase gpi13 [Dipsacomyces acuminosporus]|nr:mannose-ethanolamine phosphotransferase gpi13 [Dipsacomyces acuminosporus]
MAQSGSAQPEQEGLPRPENANARGSKGSDTQTVNLSTRSHWVLSAMFLAVSAIGFWLFSRGFLLTRMVLPDHSLSSALPFTPEQTFGPVPGGSSKELRPCGWYPPKFDRTIVLVVDALRIDFATWSDALSSTDVGPDSHTPLRLKPYHNRLPVIDALTKQHPEQAMLYRFRADPPTTTLQRLKGLTTGQLPTFIDAGSNFAGSAIDEDNWIQALRWPSIYTCNQTADSSGPNKGHKRNLVFLGDDTWSSLFPQELSDTFTKEASDGTVPEFEANGTGIRGWARVRPFPSLNVWDLDTVDDGVISRLPMFLLPPTQLDQSLSTEEAAGMQAKREQWRQLVKQPATFSHSDFAADGSVNTMASTRVGLKQLHEEWDVMIAHCLGVDHCGHRFGPDHPAISQKLRQMNQVIELIVDSINKSNRSTALYVFGDHGMDPKGDHGGDSPREVDAALWVYSNTKWNTKKGAERTSRVLKRTKEILESEPLGATLDDDLKDGWWENAHLSDDYWSKDDGYLFQPQRLRSIPQIDLVSSLTLSLGLPVPFNSLGAVIPEMFASDDSVNGEWGLLHALRLNSAQVMRYLTTYMSNSRSHGFSDDVVQLWKDMYARAEKSYKDFRDVAALKPKGSAVSDAEEAAAAQYYAFLRIMLGTLRQMWAQFDPVLMLAGLCVLVLSIVSLALVYVQSRQITLESIVDRAWRTCLSGGVSGMIIARALATVLVSNTSSHISSLESAVGGLAIGLTVSFCAAALTRFAAWYSSPFCLDVAITSVPQTSPITASSKAKAKAKAKSDNPDPPRQTAVILGYGNAYGAAYLIFVTVVFCVLYLVQQPMGGIMLSFLFIKLMFCAELFDALRDVLNKNGLDSVSLLPAQIILLALLSYLDYFSTGHQFTLVSIQWSTAFVGVREMHLVICGLIVGLNTFGSFIFTALCVPLVVLWNVSLGSQLLRIAPAHYFAQIAGAGSAYAAYHALTASTTAIFAAWFRRHLMVWKIFAPRFMFSAPVFLISATAVLVIAAGLAAVRILRMGLKVGNVQALVAQKMARHA